jgi:hypothetical protein
MARSCTVMCGCATAKVLCPITPYLSHHSRMTVIDRSIPGSFIQPNLPFKSLLNTQAIALTIFLGSQGASPRNTPTQSLLIQSSRKPRSMPLTAVPYQTVPCNNFMIIPAAWPRHVSVHLVWLPCVRADYRAPAVQTHMITVRVRVGNLIFVVIHLISRDSRNESPIKYAEKSFWWPVTSGSEPRCCVQAASLNVKSLVVSPRQTSIYVMWPVWVTAMSSG